MTEERINKALRTAILQAAIGLAAKVLRISDILAIFATWRCGTYQNAAMTPVHVIECALTRTFNCMDGAFSSAVSQFPNRSQFSQYSHLLPSLSSAPPAGSGQDPAPPPRPCRLFSYLLPPPRNDVTCRSSHCYMWRVTSLRVARNTLTRAS